MTKNNSMVNRLLSSFRLLLLVMIVTLGVRGAFGQAFGFGAAAALNSNAAIDSGSDFFPDLITDNAGNWIVVWQIGGAFGSDFDIAVSRSTDNGSTWSVLAPLNSNATSDTGRDNYPQLTTDGAGNWITAWYSNDDLGGTIGTDYDVLYSRSTDNGVTWTTATALNTNAATDTDIDGDTFSAPQIATDGLGNWVATWYYNESDGVVSGPGSDLYVSRSTDSGLTWTSPVLLNTNAALETGVNLTPRVATDGAGNWVAVWYSSDSLGGTIGTDLDILFARSTDNGATWTAPVALNTNAATDSGGDYFPKIETDGAGHWITIWHSLDSLEGTIGTEGDVLYALSTDNGVTWSAIAALNSNAAVDSGFDNHPQIAIDESTGNWFAVWAAFDGSDRDIMIALSTNFGVTWTIPAPLTINNASDQDPQIATDQTGNWVAVWFSNETLGGTIGMDNDLLYSTRSSVLVEFSGFLIQ